MQFLGESSTQWRQNLRQKVGKLVGAAPREVNAIRVVRVLCQDIRWTRSSLATERGFLRPDLTDSRLLFVSRGCPGPARQVCVKFTLGSAPDAPPRRPPRHQQAALGRPPTSRVNQQVILTNYYGPPNSQSYQNSPQPIYIVFILNF